MNGRKHIALLLVIPLLGTPLVHAAAVAYVGPYSGGAELMARLKPKQTPVRDFQADIHGRNVENLGWKGMVGVRMTPRFAFEAGFMDFGKGTAPAPTRTQPLTARTRSFTAFGVSTMPVGKLDVFAKAGPVRIETNGHVGGSYFERQQKKIGYGAGVQMTKRRLVVRAEYEKLGTWEVGNLDAVSLGFRLSLRPD